MKQIVVLQIEIKILEGNLFRLIVKENREVDFISPNIDQWKGPLSTKAIVEH